MMRAWAAAVAAAAALLLAAAPAGQAATARETVRLGYFTEAQPFEVACARGWFEAADLDVEVVCLPHAESDASSPKQPPKFAPGANGARMARAPTGIELKEVMRQHGSSAGGQSLRSRPSRRLSFTGHLAGGDGVDDGRRLAETRTQKHRRANLPRRTSAFSSRHDANV